MDPYRSGGGYTCQYCGRVFHLQYDLNNHYVVCSSRTGKYSAAERGMLSQTTKNISNATSTLTS